MRFIPLILFITILILPAFTLLTLRKEIGLERTRGDKVSYFHGKENIQFSFISPKKNLNSVVLRLENINKSVSVGRNSKPLYFSLLENQQILRKVQINGSNFVNDAFVRFAFPEIEDSENKKYIIILSSPESEGGEALGIFTDAPGNPVIITYHIPSSKVQLMLDIYQDFINRLLADKIFIIIWFVILGSTILIIKRMIKV